MLDTIMTEYGDKMNKTIDFLYQDIKSIRTGRANIAILDAVKVDYYGDKLPLNQVATLSAADATTLLIDPWDKSVIKTIEKAIEASDLGLTPSNDGVMIRLNIPSLTQERRQGLLKVLKKKIEENKVAIRNIRREANDKIKKMEKDSEISEDESKKAVDKVQTMTDKHIDEITRIFTNKEKELLEV